MQVPLNAQHQHTSFCMGIYGIFHAYKYSVRTLNEVNTLVKIYSISFLLVTCETPFIVGTNLKIQY